MCSARRAGRTYSLNEGEVSLYKILQLPILCGVYCNNGESGGNVILRGSAGGDGVGWGT